ncbi:uncharacterized protein LOC101456057 [Ceratitis capitata]|uniref:uncharacterized protein LOC101456057 n=1 Tax=Ceratitis capitata TaxID=7213 RepID=UPI000329B03E|nr:uncharacterized protein LOC101456057 [Ceratitis capitata]
MELRNSKTNQYKSSLINLGLYENGMKLEEMRQVMQAIEESELECETAFYEADLERALKESELDYVQMHSEAHSSTMIKQTNIVRSLPHCPMSPQQNLLNSDASPFSSPEIASEKVVVQAIVHHELNWSPPQFRKLDQLLNAKSLACLEKNNGSTEKRKVDENEHDENIIKRSRLPITSSPKSFENDSENHSGNDSDYASQITDDSQSDPSF